MTREHNPVMPPGYTPPETQETAIAHGRCPFATWSPLHLNYREGGNRPRLYIVHIMQGTLAGTDSWFRNPVSMVSSHFGVSKTGKIVQWVNCDDTAWHAAEANDHSIGVEHEGWSGSPLTTAQLDATARLFDWARIEYPEIHNWLTTRPDTGSGLAWHGLGGVPWGNHPTCPGSPIVHQLPEILAGP